MASFRNSSLYRLTSSAATASPPPTIDLLSGAAEDDPWAAQPEPMEGIKQMPRDTTQTEELFDFLEGGNMGAATPLPSTQAENPYKDELEGLEIAEPTVQLKKEVVRSPSVWSPSATAVPKIPNATAEERSQAEDTERSAQKRITDYFRKAAVRKARMTDYYLPATAATETSKEKPLLKETKLTAPTEEAPRQSEPAKESDVTQMEETAQNRSPSTTGKPTPSTAERLQSRQDVFAKLVTDDFDITQQIIGESLLSGRGRRDSSVSSVPRLTAPHSRTPSSASALSVASPTLSPRVILASSAPDIAGSRWATRSRQTSNDSRDRPTSSLTISTRRRTRGGLALPAHLAGARRSDDSGAAARAQHDAPRGRVLVPNPTRQLPTPSSIQPAGHGSGVAAPLLSSGFSGTIRARPGPSMLNRGGLFSRDNQDDDPKDQPSRGRSSRRHP